MPDLIAHSTYEVTYNVLPEEFRCNRNVKGRACLSGHTSVERIIVNGSARYVRVCTKHFVVGKPLVGKIDNLFFDVSQVFETPQLNVHVSISNGKLRKRVVN